MATTQLHIEVPPMAPAARREALVRVLAVCEERGEPDDLVAAVRAALEASERAREGAPAATERLAHEAVVEVVSRILGIHRGSGGTDLRRRAALLAPLIAAGSCSDFEESPEAAATEAAVVPRVVSAK